MSSDYLPREKYTATEERIISTTIASLSEQGYADTSIGGVAKRLDVSKGLVHYHFSSKEVLFQETIAYIYAKAFRFLRPRIDAAPDYWGRVEQFIRMSSAFYQTHPEHIKALYELRSNFHPRHHTNYAITRYNRELADVGALLAEGQGASEFREFDTHIMALTLRQALNGLVIEMAKPSYDIAHHTNELVALFHQGLCRKR